jgi:hypothetical protein
MSIVTEEHEPDPTALTGRSSVDAVIRAFVAAVDPSGERRRLRAALSHVEAGLGTMPIRAVRPRHVATLLDHLQDAGLSDRREAAVVEALHSLFAYAIARGLVAADPVDEPERRGPPTPTLTMIALGAKVALWTTWLVTVAFIGLAVMLVVELA